MYESPSKELTPPVVLQAVADSAVSRVKKSRPIYEEIMTHI